MGDTELVLLSVCEGIDTEGEVLMDIEGLEGVKGHDRIEIDKREQDGRISVE